MEKHFRAELEAISVTCHDGSVDVPGLGQMAHLSLYDNQTYGGQRADLILEPGDEARVMKIIDELRQDVAAQRRALERPLAETLKLRPAVFTDGMFTPTPEDDKRRKQALASMFWRFPQVEARMKEVYGLRLPRHLAVWAALERSLTPLEQLGQHRAGRYSSGIMLWFENGGLDKQTKNGLDPRLESRFRCDPPEFVTVMHGDTDGLHYGLWYDDPAELPSFLASNYARDSAETGRDEPTVISELLEQMRRRIEEPDYPEETEPLCLHAFIAALKWFREADEKALAEDGPRRWADAPRSGLLGGLGPALMPSHGNPRGSRRDCEEREKAYREKKAQPIIEQAFRELKQGKPALALVVGRELHWCDADETRAASLELLVGAYQALGRHALAEIARVHHANRDLKSVGVY